MSLIDKIKSAVKNAFLQLTNYNYINGKYMEFYLKGVENDIDLLKERMDFPKFERDRDPLFGSLVKKYEEAYCPSTFYDLFSLENKARYFDLRQEINSILSRRDQPYSDFLFQDDEKDWE